MESPRERNELANGHGYLPQAHVDAVKPNILYIMADQMAAPALKMHDPSSVIQTPNIDSLAQSGVVFNKAYCPSPLCAPSRFTMVTGQLPSKIRGYDNASQLSSDVPTFSHYLRRAGYETTLAGKMHFIGPDQLHGWENRLTPDIYPGDFGWAVNWDDPEKRLEWYHNMSSVLQAGPCVRSNQLDYDEDSMHKSTQYLYDYVRQPRDQQRPFALTVSLTHPHDPYAITEDLWDQYEDVDIPLPKISVKQSQQDSHSVRLMKCIDLWDNPMPEEAIKRARRAYYGACTYVDNQVGKLLKVLKDCKLDKNTVVIFSSDHGDMLGERNLWYKMNWFEMSARVPLIVRYPARFAPHRVNECVSTMDLLPTLVELVGEKVPTELPLDGKSFYGALLGEKAHDEVFGEYMGEGTISPVVMIRRGRYKYIASLVDAPQLYDMEDDPHEINNLAPSPENAFLAKMFADEVKAKWDLQRIHNDVLLQQRQRRVCWEALRQGKWEPWDYTPPNDGATKYIRSTLTLDELELKARYPPVNFQGRPIIVTHPRNQAGALGE
ncbi:choline-sulfatase [Rhizodiscina lignyota]|uniref:Choline-sulfatase n=1 Tax=Rhizodiscina lignyota TaxID=1504668 RepID=A0A9P4I711_9PEZI|nr:choline-sulfatase [Rhizodiscina lignyota]